MSSSYERKMLAGGRANSQIFPYSNPAIPGSLWDNWKDGVEQYLHNYMISEFCKKDIRFRIPTLDILAKELRLVGSRKNLQNIYKSHFTANIDEDYFDEVDVSILDKIPENILIPQCFLMSTPMYLLYDNRKNNRFDKELYVYNGYLMERLNEMEGPFTVVTRENLKGGLVGLRLFIDKARDKYEELRESMDPKDFYWEVWDGYYEKLSAGYRPGEKNRLGYFVPEPVISILKDKYLLGIGTPPTQFDRSEMLNWMADIVFIDFVNEKTYGKKCKARVFLNSIEGVYPDFYDEENQPHLDDNDMSCVKFTTESGNKITVDLFGLQEIHKISRIS